MPARCRFFLLRCCSTLVLTIAFSARLAFHQAAAADCTEEAQLQAHELALFSDMKRIKNCETPDGVAAFKESAALLATLRARDALLAEICTSSNARLDYVRGTLKNLSSFFKRASAGCESVGLPAVTVVANSSVCGTANASAGRQELAAIPKCAAIYCASDATPTIKEDIKHIDDRLVELQLRTAEMASAAQKFHRTCRALGNDTRAGTKLDDFKTSAYEFGIVYGRLSDLYEALQKSPEEDVFARTMANAARVFRQPDCMMQINQARADAMNAAESETRKGTLSCDAFNP